MAKNANKIMGTSWTVIILMLIIFFPVGIVMLVKKVKKEKSRYDENGKTMIVLGWVLMLLGVYYFFDSFTSEIKYDSLFFLLTLLWVGGVALVFNGRKYRNKASRIARYRAIISNQSECFIDEIAQVFPTSFDNTCRNLQTMIDEGFLVNSYIDLPKGKLIIKNQDSERQTNETIKCPFCGATIKVAHKGLYQCEYCGSHSKS
jgi:hypothetical protein